MPQLRTRLLVFICVIFLSVASAAASQQDGKSQDIDVPYQKFVLKNGLTLIVHEDHKAPIVAVNVWYHVGSKNEKPGKSGFAHLFEHLMFNGSENFDDDYFQALERVGATDLNGTTNEDRTNYFQNVPSSALDVALWMESDRMGHLLGAITEDKLDEQRGVVQNEKRQSENRPYSVSHELITTNTYPSGHPYSWTVIGSMEDLNAASLEDVREWFRTYYGAANAVIAIAGDVNVETARRKVEKFFGDIPAGPPIPQQRVSIAKMTGTKRQSVRDRVAQARLYKVWNIPAWRESDTVYLDLISDILASGKTSRLYKRLVYDEQIATTVNSFIDAREIGSQFHIQVTARPGEGVAAVEAAVDEELGRLLLEGPTDEELERVRTEYEARFVRGIERIGGFGGKSDILARGQIYAGSPDHYKTRLQRIGKATVEELSSAAQHWLSDGVYILEVLPFPEYTSAESSVDRNKLPPAGVPPQPEFPQLHRATLSNGLKVVLAQRGSIPLVELVLLLDAGYAADQFGHAGTANLAMNMLDEGTVSRSALDISEEVSRLGARLSTGSNLDLSFVSLSALSKNLDASLELYADVVLNPTFPERDFTRLQKQQLAAIQREKLNPVQMALRVFPLLLYGEGHAYATPFTGSGTEESVVNLSRSDLVEFHKTWFKPNAATLVVVGDTTLQQVIPKLENSFRTWQPGSVPSKNISSVELADKPVLYLVDKPGSIQSVILAGHIAPPPNNPDEMAVETLNNILGGTFTGRINMNLREDKHWSYGARSLLYDARGQRPFIVFAPVQADKTRESVLEILGELRGIVGTVPPTQQELNKIRENRVLRLPGSWETLSSVSRSISRLVRFGLADDYYDHYPERIRSLRLGQVERAARATLHPDRLAWVIVGDRSKIEEGIRQLNLGDIHFIDADGRSVQ